MRVLVTGATGFLGARVVREHDPARVVALSRDPEAARRRLGDVAAYAWDALEGPPPVEAFRDVGVVYNLVGESVDARWTRQTKRRIHDSRVLGTRRLVETLAASPARPRVLVSASAVGYYGDRGDEELDESSAPGSGFLAELAVAWEREALAAAALGVRVVCARLGIALGTGGGVLAPMLGPFRLGLGGRMGSGRQWMSWIHVDDAVGLLLHAAARDDVAGPLNVTSPNPARNAELTRALAAALGRPAPFVVPAFALKAVLGERAQPIFTSQRALPRAAVRAGYTFRHPALGPALASLFGR
jgi:hypothetical protein